MSAVRWGALALAFILAVVWTRVWTSARSELAAAETARAGGQVEESIRHYQYAIRWYTPGASAPTAALTGLRAYAIELEAGGDAVNALRAWRRLRGAIRATRSLYIPFGEHASEVDQHLARLMATQQLALGQPTIRGRSRAQLEADHLTLLQLDATPATGWGLLVVLSFVGWVAGGFGTVFRGFDREARVVKPGLWRWGALTTVCFGLWLLGLGMA